jgi:hypothetical protein
LQNFQRYQARYRSFAGVITEVSVVVLIVLPVTLSRSLKVGQFAALPDLQQVSHMKIFRSFVLAQVSAASILFPFASFAAGAVFDSDYKIDGPFVSKNLQVFIVHGANTSKSTEIQTLSEAMKANTFKVFETGSVNELACQNLSDRPVFVQSGDIVKGGRQDRTMQYDLLVPPHSKKISLSAFCVESGRWQQRGSESAAVFSSSTKSLAGKELKLAAKYQGNQGAVWQQVADHQKKLQGAHAQAAPTASPTSYELTMEDGGVQKNTAGYTKDLQALAEKDKDAIGYAFSINGKLNSADLYASHYLFVKLWPKLLESAAVEAVASPEDKSVASKPSGVEDVKTLLHANEKAQPREQQISEQTKQRVRDGARSVDFETRADGDSWLHKNYIVK